MRSLKTLLTVIGAVTVLVLASNTVALAATGHAFILGKGNKANKVTALKRTTGGPALRLSTTSTAAAPMVVNGKGRVANLNADALDGLDSSALRTGTHVFTKLVSAPTPLVTIPISLPAGTYLLGYSAYMTNGGNGTDPAGCYFNRKVNGANSTFVGETATATYSDSGPSVSGTGVVTMGTGVTLILNCYGAVPFTTPANNPIQITATRTQLLSGGSIG